MQWAPFTWGEPPARAQCAACSEATLAGGHAAHGGLELTTSGRLPGPWEVSTGYAWPGGRMTKSLATTTSTQLPTAAVAAVGKVPALTPECTHRPCCLPTDGLLCGIHCWLGMRADYSRDCGD